MEQPDRLDWRMNQGMRIKWVIVFAWNGMRVYERELVREAGTEYRMIKTRQIEWEWKGDMKWKTDEGEYGNGCLKKVNEFVLNELIMIEMPKP